MNAFLAELRRVAVVLSAEEDRLRARTRDQLAAMTERRQRAYRRWNLLQAMAQAAAAGGAPAALAMLVEEIALRDDAALRTAAQSLAESVAAAVRGDATADPISALDALESWHHARHGGDLLAPAQAGTHFQPPVDF